MWQKTTGYEEYHFVTRKREFDVLAEAAEELCCERLLVVTNDREEETEWKEKRLSGVSVGQFCSWLFY